MRAETHARIERFLLGIEAIAVNVQEGLIETDSRPVALQRLSIQFAALTTDAQQSGWRGLACLLRPLTAGMQDILQSERQPSEDDWFSIASWLTYLVEYIHGRLPPEEFEQLLSTFDAIAWVPAPAGAMRAYALARLREAPYDELAEMQTLDNHQGTAEAFSGESISGLWVTDTVPEPAAFVSVSSTSAETDFPEMDDVFSDLRPISNTENLETAWHEQSGGKSVTKPEMHDESVDKADAVLWLSPEEQQLLFESCAQQLLPLISEMAQTQETEQLQQLLDDYGFQLSLLSNAFDLCRLPQLALTVNNVRTDVVASVAVELATDRLVPWMNWQIAILGLLESPDSPEAQTALIEAVTDPSWPQATNFAEAAKLKYELSCIRIGLDPKIRALRKQIAEPEDVTLNIAADVLPTVLDGMLRELPVNVRHLTESVQSLVKTGAADVIDAARRAAHTLKGDANIVGLKGIANFTHVLEDIFGELAKSLQTPKPELAMVLIEAVDNVEAMAEHVLGRGPLPQDALTSLQSLLTWSNALQDGEETIAVTADEMFPSIPALPVESSVPAIVATETAEINVQRSLQIAVTLLDELLRLSSESIVLSQQVEEELKVIASSHAELGAQSARSHLLISELDDLVALRGASLSSARLLAAEIDPLELDQYNELHVLSRRLIEANTDERAFASNVAQALARLRDLMAAQDQLQSGLQGTVLRTRMIPFGQMTPRFQRAVRQSSRLLAKTVELEVRGDNTLIDSDVLEAITDPIMHALRNAVDHGIEAADLRLAAGKTPVGHILLNVWRAGDTITILVEDDGSGLDFDAIRQRAIALGLISETIEIDNAQLTRFIMLPGFSTRTEATQISGRGIGMDAIATKIKELKGRIRIHSDTGVGTKIEITLPNTLVSAHVAVVPTLVGAVALVASSFNRFLPVNGRDIQLTTNGWKINLDSIDTDIIPIELLLGNKQLAQVNADKSYVAAEVSIGDVSMLILTEGIREMRNVIIKNLGPYVPVIEGIRGVAILGDGSVAPVLDLNDLTQKQVESGSGIEFTSLLSNELIRLPRILVVDDSLSVRRSLATLLADSGFEVDTAVDGLDALRIVESRSPDVLLVDLEMPRMNGLELSSYLRKREATRQLPIIMITSRSTERHRAMAESAGIDTLLTKPYSDDELLGLIAHYIGEQRPIAA